MSGKALIWAANVKGLPPIAKLVLIQLAERHNKDNNRCDPSLSKLADDCEMSRASLLRHLKVLEVFGAINRIPQGKENGGRTSTQYDMPIDEKSDFHRPIDAVSESKGLTSETGGKGLTSDRQRSHICKAKVSHLRPPYIDEPLLNLIEPVREREQSNLLSNEDAPHVDPLERTLKEFYDIYPKRSDKKHSTPVSIRPVLKTALKKISAEELLIAARNYADHGNHENGRFARKAIYWLREEEWEKYLTVGSSEPSSDPQTERYRRIISEWGGK